MSAFVNNVGIPRGLKRGVISGAWLLLATGCMTGESTFQDQQAELFSFGDPEAPWVGEVNSWETPVEKSLQPPTAAEPIEVVTSGRFQFSVPRSWEGELLRARVQQPSNASMTLLDIDGRLGDVSWCLNHASDFVAPRARVLRAGATQRPEVQASEELLEALPFIIADVDALRFDQTCLSDGDTPATRAMLILSYVLWELRARDLDAFVLEREGFAQSGTLSEDSVAFMRDAAEKAGDGSTALDAFLRQRASAPEADSIPAPDYTRVFDFDGDGVPDFYRSCDPATDEECRCTADDPNLCRCGNGVLEQGERCEPELDGPACDESCDFLTVCGDGLLEGNERYDEGPQCAGLDCHPERCELDTDTCEGWVKRDFNSPAPQQAWRLQDGELQRLVWRADDRVIHDEETTEILSSTGDALVARIAADTEGLLILPSPSEAGLATLWLPNGSTETVQLETSGASTHTEVQCAAILDGSPEEEVRLVVGWGGGVEEGVELQEWRLFWNGGVLSSERVHSTSTSYERCTWMQAHSADGFLVGHEGGVSLWSSANPAVGQEEWTVTDLRDPAALVQKDDVVLWDASGVYRVSVSGALTPLDLCLPMDADAVFAPKVHGGRLVWAIATDGMTSGLELGFVEASNAPWQAPSTLYGVAGEDFIFVGQGLGVWVERAGRSTLYEFAPASRPSPFY